MDDTDPTLNRNAATGLTSIRDAFKSKGGLARLIPASRYALQGLKAALHHEAAFRQELMVAAIAFAASFWIAPSFAYGVLMNLVILLVLAFELINSAIEALADAISLHQHPLIGRAKDMGSAAVLIAIIIACGVWANGLYLRFLSS